MRERPKSSSNTVACAFIASIPRDEPIRIRLLPKSPKRGHPTGATASNRRYSQALPLRLARFSFKSRAVTGERSAVPIKPGACSGQQHHKNQQGGAPDPEHETEQQNNGHPGRPYEHRGTESQDRPPARWVNKTRTLSNLPAPKR